MVCNLLCHNLSNMKPQYHPNSCFYWRESSKTSINLRMNLILFHTSLIMPVWYYSSDLCLYSRLPLSAGIYPPPIYRPWLKMVKYILPHTPLTNNWFAPPRITELVLKSGRHEKVIRLCLVPYFRSPQAYCPHTFLPSSVRYWLSILLLIQFQYFHYTTTCILCLQANTPLYME